MRSDREKQVSYNIKFLKNDTNELIYKTEVLTDTGNKFKVTKGKGGRDKLGVRD